MAEAPTAGASACIWARVAPGEGDNCEEAPGYGVPAFILSVLIVTEIGMIMTKAPGLGAFVGISAERFVGEGGGEGA